jgi:DNA helicase HerA-like ATPase
MRLLLGTRARLDGRRPTTAFELPSHHLLTHAVVVGMTGSGKTGLVTVLVEEALRAGIPSIVFDIKGDLPNLALAFPDFETDSHRPWIEPAPNDDDGIADDPLVSAAIAQRREGLAQHAIGAPELADYAARTFVRVITPGSEAGEPLHLLSALERRSSRWDHDLDGARANLSAAVSLVLQLIGRTGDPGRSREHAFLSVLAETRLLRGEHAPLEALLPDLLEPPLDHVGALAIDDFLSLRARKELAADLNTLLTSPRFLAWRRGPSLDVDAWMRPVDGRTPTTVISVAHLDDEERALVLGVILEEVLTWVRSLPGTSRLKGLVVFDELYGFLPPHPASPPTKRPLVALMKQARAYGIGCVLATQNPMDLDYRALSNAGTWCIGRLQTDADRARVLEGLGEDKKKSRLGALVKGLGSRWFVVRDAKTSELSMLRPRWAMSYLKGPLTPIEIRKIREEREAAPSA